MWGERGDNKISRAANPNPSVNNSPCEKKVYGAYDFILLFLELQPAPPLMRRKRGGCETRLGKEQGMPGPRSGMRAETLCPCKPLLAAPSDRHRNTGCNSKC